MKNDDELFLRELEFAVKDSTEQAALRIAEDIEDVSKRLTNLRHIARMRKPSEGEGWYLYGEIDRLKAALQAHYAEYIQLYNMLLESASEFVRPNEITPE